ncbi:MAG: protein phosphatase 2C domain-containing protein, partial [Lactococcus lactis]|nr:protein phosphatase 2C domain-containing protein [Lactococcus lactis]
LDEYQGMGTTLEALVIKGNTIVSAHVGDSRTYLMRDGELNKITTDHSLVQELVDAGQITEEEAEVHPNKNIITRSLGQTNEVQADIQALELQAGDIILMNSDGLTNMVSTTEIMEVLEREDLTLDNKSEALIRLANEHGGLDNITVVLIKFEETSEAETQAQEVS